MGRSACLFVAALGLCAGLCAQPTPSFRNDIIPALTKLGCNSGQCLLLESLIGQAPAISNFEMI